MQQCAQPPPAGVQHAFWHCAPHPNPIRAVLGLSNHIHFTFEWAAGDAISKQEKPRETVGAQVCFSASRIPSDRDLGLWGIC